MADTEQSRRRVQSIEVGFRVLRVLRMAEGPLPLREIAARAGMPPSKVHLYLVSFVRENMAYQDLHNGHYGLGSFAIQLGLAAIRQLDVVALAADTLTELRDKTDCAIYLSLWGDRGPCIVAKADGTLQGAFLIRLGYILPMTTTATGLVFLAHLPPVEAERALGAQAAYDADRVRTRALSKEELAESSEKIRKDGYSSTAGMLNRNFAAIAAPIFDHSGKIAATITLLGPTDYMSRTRLKEFSKMLLASTQAVSERMGAIPKPPEKPGKA
ncbi:MAG: IclR family transcriptional regulator [Sphingomonas sp.]|jgi:DNA-binding IclR family transcriptional regulator|uniref:IclR family transcriptional regulator n=1 Tax=Sphingomonas sp. TaxID=28214 RepID=UPI00356A7A9A